METCSAWFRHYPDAAPAGDFAQVRKFVRERYPLPVDEKARMDSAVMEICSLLEAGALPVGQTDAWPRNDSLPEFVAATCAPRLRAEWVRLAAARGFLKGLGVDPSSGRLVVVEAIFAMPESDGSPLTAGAVSRAPE